MSARTRSGRSRRGRPSALFQLCGLLTVILAFGPTATATAETYVTISGSGSTWSALAVQAWAADVAVNGLTVNYGEVGSTTGRRAYINGTADFAISEIPFQLVPNGPEPAEDPRSRPHALLPIVAGGTSFMYHVTVGGEIIRDLRLDGETVTKIFTGVITNWNDPQITRDYGKALPNIPIIPVVRQDGSGTSAQFSLWMSTQYPDLWNAHCQRSGLPVPCGLTSFYPQFATSVAQAFSNGVANYVAASFGEGAITYVEYAYALGLNFPVAKVLNKSGYYTGPTASNVAVALTKANVNPTTLEQELSAVYNNPDKRTYPLSSYSYMIVPTTTAQPMTADKGKSLSTFINYFLCEGQQDAEVLGYSPLPINLVEAGFDQVRKIPGFVAPPAIAGCNNPAFEILQNAPNPSECDKVGVTTCDSTASPGGGGGGGGTDPNTPGPGTGGTDTGTGAVDENGVPLTPEEAAAAAAAAAAVGVDPETGLALGAADGQDGLAVGTVQDLGAFRNSSGQTRVMYGLTAAELLLAVTLPPVMAMLIRRRRAQAGSSGGAA